MNRAEKRRQRKLATKAAKDKATLRSVSPSPGQQTLTIEKQVLTIKQALDLAVQHHSTGRLSQAEQIYRQILEADPNQPIALHYLGVIAHQRGKNKVAVDLINQSLAIKPDYADAYSNLGVALKDLGRLDEAVASYRKAIAIQPDYADVHSNLSVALKDLGRLDEATVSCHKAIAIDPGFAAAHSNLADALNDLGRLDEAVASYRKTIAIKPDAIDVLCNLGNILKGQGKLGEAVASYRKAIAISPEYADAHSNLGNALQDLGRLDEAIVSYQKAIAIKPDFAEAHNNLGNALKALDRLDEALASCHTAIAIKPDFAVAHSSLGNVLGELGRLDEAVASYQKAIAIKPGYAEAHNNLGVALRNLGRLDEAVASYLKATHHDSKNESLYINLGDIYAAQGQREYCAKIYSEAYKLGLFQEKVNNSHPQPKIDSSSNSSDQLRNLFVSTVPRSGTHYWTHILHYLSEIYKNPERKFDQIIDRKAEVPTFKHAPHLGLNLSGVSHMLCPRVTETLEGERLKRWNSLDFHHAYCPYPKLFHNETSTNKFISEYGGFDLNNENVRIVFVYRNPLDQCVSMFNHHRNHQNNLIKGYFDNDGLFHFFRDVNELILNGGLESYLKLYLSYYWSLPKYNKQIKLISYESFKRDPMKEMNCILEFVETMPSYDKISTVLEQVLDLCSPDSLRQVEKETGKTLARDQLHTNEFNSHIRDGGTGNWKGLIDDNTIKEIDKEFNEFGISLNDFETGM